MYTGTNGKILLFNYSFEKSFQDGFFIEKSSEQFLSSCNN